MNKSSMLLISLTLFLALLSHDSHAMHGRFGPPEPLPLASLAHAGDSVVGASLMHQHHALPELDAQVCTGDQQVAPQVASGSAHIAIAVANAWHAPLLSLSAPTPPFEEPAYPPDVRRALLQVYLN